MRRTTCVLYALLSVLVIDAQPSSYAELIEEDRLDLTPLQKAGAAYLRALERQRGGGLSAKDMGGIRSFIQKVRDMVSQPAQEQIPTIRIWVKQVAAVLDSELEPASRTPSEGPLHKVLDRACAILEMECDNDHHPYVTVQKKITPAIADFTQAVVDAHQRRARSGKDEL